MSIRVIKSTSAEFVKQNERVDGGVLQDGCRFTQLDKERTLSSKNVIVGSEASEETIDGCQFEFFCRNERSQRPTCLINVDLPPILGPVTNVNE